jgi:hypothetical protein
MTNQLGDNQGKVTLNPLIFLSCSLNHGRPYGASNGLAHLLVQSNKLSTSLVISSPLSIPSYVVVYIL